MNEFKKCGCCGMPTNGAVEYHPYAACLMFHQTHSSIVVEANLKAVVEYGMLTAELGISLEDAMRDITKVRKSNEG